MYSLLTDVEKGIGGEVYAREMGYNIEGACLALHHSLAGGNVYTRDKGYIIEEPFRAFTSWPC